MMHPTRAGIGLVRLGDSDFVSANPEDDLRGKAVYDAEGQRIGGVEDLYIDRHQRQVRFLEVGTGGFLGIGKKRFLVQVEAVMQIAENQITIEPGRTERVDRPASFHIKVASPSCRRAVRRRSAARPYQDRYRPPAERASHLGSWALSCEPTTSTGQGARRITASEILPSMALLIPRWPLQPITIRSAPSSLAKATTSRSTAPILR